MEHRPSPVMDFDHMTDDGLRDHLLACSDWLLTHDDAGVRESYRAGRDVLRVRIEHRAVRRARDIVAVVPAGAAHVVVPQDVLRTRVTLGPAWSRDSAVPMVRAHLQAGGTAVYGGTRLRLNGDGDIVSTVNGLFLPPDAVVELWGVGQLRRVFDDALRVVSGLSPAELVRAIEGVTSGLIVSLRAIAARADFGSFDASRCLTWASSVEPPVHPLVVAVAVLLLAADS